MRGAMQALRAAASGCSGWAPPGSRSAPAGQHVPWTLGLEPPPPVSSVSSSWHPSKADLPSWPAQDVNPSGEGLLADLLWADPSPNVSGWCPNPRGVSFVFGLDVAQARPRGCRGAPAHKGCQHSPGGGTLLGGMHPAAAPQGGQAQLRALLPTRCLARPARCPPPVQEWLRSQGLRAIVRAHMVQQQGFEVLGKNEVMTVFSASDYRESGEALEGRERPWREGPGRIRQLACSMCWARCRSCARALHLLAGSMGD